VRRLAVLLRPVLTSLEGESASMQPILVSNERAVHRLRVVLVALWSCLLQLLQPQLETMAMRADISVIYQVLTRILLRPEFGAQHLLLDANGRATCDASTLANARRYRRLLRATHRFVIEQLGVATQLSSTQPFTLFAVRTLAASYFRVPGAATELVGALALDENELEQMVASDKTSVRAAAGGSVRAPLVSPLNVAAASPALETVAAAASSSSSSSSSSSASSASVRSDASVWQASLESSERDPSLFMWPRYHAALLAIERARGTGGGDAVDAGDNSSGGSSIKAPPALVLYEGDALGDVAAWRVKDTAWLRILQQQGATGRVLYFLFFNEWLQHVRAAIVHDRALDASAAFAHGVWHGVVGFEALSVAFLYHMSTLSTYHKSVLDCSDQLLRAAPSVLSAYVRMTFVKTRAFDPLHILSSISHVERWLGVLRESGETVPDSFDVDFFLLGLDRIVETDHHQVLMVLLTFIYKNADLFERNARRQLFGNFLLRRHFYELFLHWDSAVRTTFHQILLFRLVRARRGGASSLEKLLSEVAERGPPEATPVAAGLEATAEIPASAIGSSLASALPSVSSGALSIEGADAFKGILGHAGVTIATLTSAALAGVVNSAGFDTDSDAIDAELLSKLEAHMRLLCDQLDGSAAVQVFEKRLAIYAERSQREYLVYLHRFLSWRGAKPPPLVSVADAHGSKEILGRLVKKSAI
jgi:hypothetical protein